MPNPDPSFPKIKFNGILRPSQKDVVAIAKKKLAEGKKRIHIVAPPGSGKTVLGLYLWAECIGVPALVLSPNSAIQAQWAARTDLFLFDPEKPGGDFTTTGSARVLKIQQSEDDSNELTSDQAPVAKENELGIDEIQAQCAKWVSTEPKSPSILTSLTYQSVTLPKRATENLDEQAEELWKEKLIEDNQAETLIEAEFWISDLREKNPDYHERRLASYRKKVRDEAALAGSSLDVLHASSRRTLERIRDANVGLIILDECHHLMGHWGRVLADARELLGDPTVVGLTATPPDRDGKRQQDIERYDNFFGQVDYEVPVPAVVKDGFLAPYQDLAYFVRPSAEELEFVATTDSQLDELVAELCQRRIHEVSMPNSEQERLNQDNPKASSIEKIDFSSQSKNAEADSDSKNVSVAPDETISSNVTMSSNEDDSHGADVVTAVVEGHHCEAREEATNPNATPSLPFWLLRVLTERRLSTATAKDWFSFERRDETFANAARKFLQLRQIKLPEDVPPLDDDRMTEKLLIDDLIPVLDRYIRHALRRSHHSEDHRLAENATSRLRMLGIQVTDTGTQACASPVGRVLAYSKNKMAALPEILKREHSFLGESIRAVIVTDFEKSSATQAEIGEILDSESGGAIAAFRALVENKTTDQLDPILLTGSSVLVDDDVVDQFFDAARTWLKENGFNVDLSDDPQDGFHVIKGSGGDWCPRVYVEMITELFQRGVTKCLVRTRGLLGEGWDANKINVLIDLTTVTTSMTVNQLRGRSIRLDPQVENKLANNWDVICIAPEFTKGLDDYKRFEAKHKTLFGVTDDGAIEKGVGHVHAAFTELKPEGIEGSTRILNEDMLRRISNRDKVRQLWKIGKPFQNRAVKTIEAKLKLSGGDFPPFVGEKNPWNEKSLTAAIGSAVLQALTESGIVKRTVRVHTGERDGGYLRMFLEDATDRENEIFVDALHESLGPLTDPRYIVPRVVSRKVDTWLSKILPSIVGKFFQKDKKVRVMFHAVPSIFAKNRGKVTIFERSWNAYVSPGEAIFTQRGSGEELLMKAKSAGKNRRGDIHNKEIFL